MLMIRLGLEVVGSDGTRDVEFFKPDNGNLFFVQDPKSTGCLPLLDSSYVIFREKSTREKC